MQTGLQKLEKSTRQSAVTRYKCIQPQLRTVRPSNQAPVLAGQPVTLIPSSPGPVMLRCPVTRTAVSPQGPNLTTFTLGFRGSCRRAHLGLELLRGPARTFAPWEKKHNRLLEQATAEPTLHRVCHCACPTIFTRSFYLSHCFWG